MWLGFGTIYRELNKKVFMLFFEVMKDGQKHMAAVEKDKETLALV